MSRLAHIKVVELASVLAGPLVGTFFAEEGAEVTKFENPKGGDITRAWRNAGDKPNALFSSYFASANYGKVYKKADLLSENGRNTVLKALQEADILLTNFKKGDEEKFGLSAKFIQDTFPHLIHGQITGFGEDSARTAFDMVLQAEMGYLSMTGSSVQRAKIPVAMIDILAAHQLKEGLLLALINRVNTGKGAHVSVSLYDSALSALSNQGSAWLMNGLLPEAMGTLHPSIAPYGEILQTKSGLELVLAIGNDHQFHVLCQLLKNEKLAFDPRFIDNPSRVANRNELLEEMNALSIQLDGMALFNACMQEHLPVGRIRNLKEVFHDDDAQRLILTEQSDGETTKRVKGNVFQIRYNP